MYSICVLSLSLYTHIIISLFLSLLEAACRHIFSSPQGPQCVFYHMYFTKPWMLFCITSMHPLNQEINIDTLLPFHTLTSCSFFLQYQQYFLLISCLRLDPFVCITFSCHLSSGSFSLKQFLSLFLCVMFMRALESTTVTVWEAGWPSADPHWLFSHDQTQVMKSWQESY